MFIIKLGKIVKSEANAKTRVAERNTVSKRYSICDDVLLYAQRIVIYVCLQNRMLKEFHVE